MRSTKSTLVLDATRLAEWAHRKNNHVRKAPPGEDQPPYFIHLTEVAWMVQAAGYDDACVAAAYLHDIIEDCGYTEEQLAKACKSKKVARYVRWLSEPEKETVGPDGVKRDNWTERNASYLERMKRTSEPVLAISCTDKTSNMRDMSRFMQKGHPVSSFTKREFPTLAEKFRQLLKVYCGRIEPSLLLRYRTAFKQFLLVGR